MFTTNSSTSWCAPQHTFLRIFYRGGIRVAFLIFLQISEKCNLPSEPAPLYQTLGVFMQHRLQSSDAKGIEDFEWGWKNWDQLKIVMKIQNTVYKQFDNTVQTWRHHAISMIP